MGEALILKIDESKRGLFNRVPLALYRQKIDGRRLTPSAYALFSKIYAFSHTTDEDAVCRLTYKQVCDEFGFARATTATAFEQLRSGGKIQKQDRDAEGTAYKYVEELAGRQYDNVPQALYTAEITVRGVQRRMTLSEIRVLARLMTECSYAGNGGGKYGGGIYEVSNKTLARKLNLSETTVKKAIRALMKARLVFRTAKNKGKNRYKLSGYEVARELYDYKKRQKSKPAVSKKFVPEEVKEANARADREHYYSLLREKAERRAQSFVDRARRDDVYRDVETRLNVMELELAKAEVYDPSKLPALQDKQKRLRLERVRALERLGIDPEQLVPRWRCEKCSDTGFLPNGKACTCYREGET
ncbi:MAG: hypothetical protein IJB34_00005 [Clostridia bacterium]|nr:hypothetical protein [Clostridia bacterium]MBQ3505797.1 hypothetical protein [Clostridia bacterium]